MDLDSDDAVLQSLAQGNLMDYAKWPGVLTRLISRLEHIIRHDFPIPTLPPGVATATVIDTIPQSIDAASQNTNDDKENAPPTSVSTGASTTISPDATGETLPPQLLILFNSIATTLTTCFAEYPPHTIQRLAELILTPRRHYRSLTSYLHAVDRVVHVTSGANTYPLPAAIPEPASASVLSNGVADRDALSWSTPSAQVNLGSDESLGGALLTPIPWLRNNGNGNGNGNGSAKSSDVDAEVRTESTETIDGPNGAGSIETVSVSVNGIPSHTASSQESLRAEGGVTQGELLRQEQEAGVIPVSQLSHQVDEDEDEDEVPHARGPQEIGMEDMGPQASSSSERNGFTIGMQGIDVEAAVGRRMEAEDSDNEAAGHSSPTSPDSAETPKHAADEEIEGDRKRVKEDSGVEETEATKSSNEDEMAVDTEEKTEGDNEAKKEADIEDKEKFAEASKEVTKNTDEDVDTSTK